MYRNSLGPAQVFDLTKEDQGAAIRNQIDALRDKQDEIIDALHVTQKAVLALSFAGGVQ